MKKFLFITLLICCAAKPVQEQSTLDKWNVMTDMPLLNASLKNINGDSTHGDVALMQAIVDYNQVTRHNAPLWLYVPANCVMRLDSTFFMHSNIKLEFSPFARVVSTSAIGTANVIESIANSGISILNAHYTNYFASFINAFIQLKASPYKCRDNQIIGCSVTNTWANSAYMLANVQDADSTYYLDNTLVKNDTAINIYNPAKPHMLTFADYGTTADCKGLNILNGNRKLMVDGFYCVNTGGDNIFGYGLPQYMHNDPENGAIEIKNCFLKLGNFNIEINGNYYSNGMYIHDNKIWWCTITGGFNISTGGDGLRVINNECHNADAGNLELESVNGKVLNNKCYMVRWKDTSQGPQKAAYSSGSPRCWNVNAYGFVNTYSGNTFSADPTHPTANSPAEFDGFCIVAKAPVGDSAYGRNSYLTYTDYPSVYDISHNTFIGHTHRVLDLTGTMTRDVHFTDNQITTPYHTGNDDLVMVYGYGAVYTGNHFDMTGSSAPSSGHALIKKRSVQTDNAGEIVYGNTVKGSAWWANANPYQWIQQ